MTEEQPKKSAGLKAIEYAENQLGVHSVYEALLATRASLDETLTQISNLRDDLHKIETAIEDREFEIIHEERAKHPDMSQAQMDKHVKVAHNKDDGLRAMRSKFYELKSDLDGLEMDKTMHEHDLKIGLARLSELSGYLQYLAVAKISNMRVGGGANAGSVIPGW